MWINHTVASELNKRDAKYMRSGFGMQLLNNRGGHCYTHGQEELKIAANYTQKAQDLEKHGYSRLATEIRDLAVTYNRQEERDSKRGSYFDE